MSATRKNAMSIAGFDPSAGAGILADIKTFESLEVYGLGVCSAVTFQNENEFLGVSWIPLHQIELQIEVLMKKYQVEFVKIGLIQNLDVLNELITSMKKKYPEVKIIWDPILKASAGFQFHQLFEENLLLEILSQIFLITPNSAEAKTMMNEEDSLQAAKIMSRFCNVFLKSRTDENQNHFDVLFENGTAILMKSEILNGFAKHGSGCVLSSAIAANLSRGMNLKVSCEEAKAYTFEFLKSNGGLLGEHRKINLPIHA